MARKLWQVVIVLCLLAAPAYGQDTAWRIEPGAVCTNPSGGETTINGEWYVIPAHEVDRANAAVADKRDTEERLTRALTALENLSKPEPRWVLVGKGALVGAAIVAAFFGGVYVGR